MPAEKAIISSLKAADQNEWRALWSAYLDFYETTLPEETFASTWQRVLDQSGSLRCLVIRTSDVGPILGLTHFLLHETAWNPKPACYLQDLFVAPQARGRGLARLLIEAVADKAHGLDCCKLYWLTQDNNARARKLYDKVAECKGFIRYDYTQTLG
ncbi:MAG: GNAT family N-acetyltransferase [Cyanobacteria bacterium REEB67]|nr:GNAT family N-acetyltransferase [Cyanobacteria bacterium REEB67]